MRAYKQEVVENLTQVDGDVNIPLFGLADSYQITIIPSAGSTGSVTFDARVDKIANFEGVYDESGTEKVSIDLVSDKLTLKIINTKLESINVKPDTIVGSYSVLVKYFEAN